MPQAKFYRNFITREKRFANRTAFNTASAISTFNADVVGCYITNTSSYVDIQFEYDEGVNTKLLNSQTYIIFDGYGGYTYCAFIDRIEPNNFNYTVSSLQDIAYRIFITVDWWSTIMLNDTNGTEISAIKSSLEGNVERAHVNDVERPFGDDKYHLMNYYTTDTAEFNFNAMREVDNTNVGGNRKFLYVLMAGLGSETSPWKIGEKIIPNTLSLVIIPLFASNLFVKDINNNEYATNIGFYQPSSTLYPQPDILTDRRVVSIYCTNICPLYNEELNAIEIEGSGSGENELNDRIVNVYINGSIIPNAINGNFDEELTGGTEFTIKGVKMKLKNDTSFIPSFIVNTPSLVPTYNNLVVNIPATYEEYLSHNIAKINYYPYTTSEIVVGSSRTLIATEYVHTNSLFEYIVVAPMGGYFCKFNYSNYYANSQELYNYIGDNSVYCPTSYQDDFTAISRNNMILQEISNHFALSQKAANASALYNFGTTTAVAFETIRHPTETYYNIKKSKLFGDIGVSNRPSSLTNYLRPLNIETKSLISYDREACLKDLALYGYNTFLHPHTVLEEHQRRYFNYIKCNNAKVLVNSYNTEIRLQIEEMFNNGVWLWNTADEFGNFEVPNYPMIMEE